MAPDDLPLEPLEGFHRSDFVRFDPEESYRDRGS